MKFNLSFLLSIAFLLMTPVSIISCNQDPNFVGLAEGSKDFSIIALDKTEAREGDELLIIGKGLTDSLVVKVDEGETTYLKLSSSLGRFKLINPKAANEVTVSISKDGTVQKTFVVKLTVGSATYSSDHDLTRVCSDTVLKRSDGTYARGKRKCTSNSIASCTLDGMTDCKATADYPAVIQSSLNASHIKSGLTLGGIIGKLENSAVACSGDNQIDCLASLSLPSTPVTGLGIKVVAPNIMAGVTGLSLTKPTHCTSDGEQDCFVDGTQYKAAKLSSFTASDIRDSVQIAGLTGTVTGSPASCTADGQTSCLANASYPSAATSGAAAKILSGQTLAGILGTAPVRPSDCGFDGATGCVAISPNYVALSTAGASAKISTGQTLGGITGSALNKPANCGTDGESNCVTTAPFPALSAVGASAKIASGQLLGGIPGSAPLPPAPCSSDGEVSCVTATSYPAAETLGAAAKIASGKTLAGIPGTASGRPTTCVAEGSIGCVVDGSTYAAASTLGLSAKVISGQTVAAIAGSAQAKPSNCSSDGALGCVAVPAFPAASSAGASSKIASGQTLAGIGGNAATKPADCTVDGALGCVTVASFPSLNAAVAPGRILSGQTLGGVPGLAALRPSNCAVDGSVGCVAVSGYVATNTNGAAAKLKLGETIGGIEGTIKPSPATCSSDGQKDCLAAPLFPAVDKLTLNGKSSKIKSTHSIAGVSGTLEECEVDNQIGCITNASYPAVAKSKLSPATIKNGVTLGGVIGLYPSANYPLALAGATPELDASLSNLSSLNEFAWYDRNGNRYVNAGQTQLEAANIASGINIFSIAGTFAPPCTGDGQTSCTTSNTYPGIDTSKFTGWDIRSGKSVAGVSGLMFFNRNQGFYNRSAGTDADASPFFPDIYDTTHDSISDYSSIPVSGWPTYPVSNWKRLYFTNMNNNGLCSSSDTCVVQDLLTDLKWVNNSHPGFGYTNVLTVCEDKSILGLTNWRLPTQKELLQAIIDGMIKATRDGLFNFVGSPTSTRYFSISYMAYVGSNGVSTQNDMSGNFTYSVCVHD